MLAEAAEAMGVHALALASSQQDPVALRFSQTAIGSLGDLDSLAPFLSAEGPIVFESDFLPYNHLRAYSDQSFVPSLQVMERLSDKLEQKTILRLAGFRVPDFEPKESTESSEDFLRRVSDRWPGGFVLKWVRGGYDGKGVFISKRADHDAAIRFLEQAASTGTRVFAEQKILFVRELAQVAVRSVTGEFRTYPLVISKQHSGICDFVYGPATSYGVGQDQERRLQSAVATLAQKADLYGSFAVELFQIESGEVFANEIAPRVHNSGHFSLSCSMTSQFENHIRAVLGMPLGQTQSNECFVMKNILGSRDAFVSSGPNSPNPRWNLKWYGKANMKLGRKMGHINLVGPERLDVERELSEIEDWIDRWIKKLPAAR